MATDKSWIISNLVKAVVFVAVLLTVLSVGLKLITRHNKYVQVPDFAGMSWDEAVSAATAAEIGVVIEDSTFVYGARGGIVFSQLPKSGASVKKGRTVELTMTSKSARKVTMPALIGCSVRQAKAELRSKGLRMGKLIYQADIATNMVLRQLYRGRDIFNGDHIDAGSVIDLVLGLDFEESQTSIPDVTGMDYQKAVDVLHDNYLNVGGTAYSRRPKNYSDSLAAVVTSQSPAAGEYARMGTAVDLRLKKADRQN